jgi:hypothetical protein
MTTKKLDAKAEARAEARAKAKAKARQRQEQRQKLSWVLFTSRPSRKDCEG